MAGGKSNFTSNDWLDYVFNAVGLSGYGSSGGTVLWVSLHTASPTAAGNQQTSEATYGSYGRVGVNRNNTGWTVTSTSTSNAAVISFPACTSGANTITYVAIGTTQSATGQILYWGPLTAPLSVSTGIQPQFSIGSLVVTEA